MAKTDFKTVDEYIATFSEEEQKVLEKIRKTIQKAVPEAEGVISYQIPAFKYQGWIVYFSAYKNHYSLSFPPPFTVFEKFAEELKPYVQSKSTIQLPKSQPIPYDLMENMAKFRAEENLAKKQGAKKAKNK